MKAKDKTRCKYGPKHFLDSLESPEIYSLRNIRPAFLAIRESFSNSTINKSNLSSANEMIKNSYNNILG